MPRFRSIVVVACLIVGAAPPRAHAQGSVAPGQPAAQYEVYAVQYATLPFRVSGLIAGADTSRRVDIAMMFWLLKGTGPAARTVLVDAGFYRDAFMTQWRPANYLRPDSALASAGVRPADVTDIVVSHIHWDHFDGADLFPNARVWIQRDEVTHHVDSAGAVLNRAIHRLDAAMLHEFRRAGRLELVDGDAREIIPGITVYTGGKHTYQSQYASVRADGATVVIASDNAYLYENVDTRRPIAQTLDAASNLAAQDRMRTIATSANLIVPGHDALVFTRFAWVSPRAVRIR